MRILVISGSLRAGSYNAALARAAGRLAPAGVEVELFDGLRNLPPYDADLEGEEIASVEWLRDRIDEADALFVVTPEYNGSLPGVLKNAIDWASRPKGEAALQGKTVAIAGASTGQYGALWAIQDLRRVLGIAGARVIEGEVSVPRAHEVVDDTDELRNAVVESRLTALLAALVDTAVPEPIAA